jgi:two-component system nitrogen regulation sensor histidine kinase NtrY
MAGSPKSAEQRGDPAERPGGRSWRRREATLLVAAVLAAIFFLLFETRMPPFTSGQTQSQNVFFFLLINLNIVLLLLVVFLLGRNVIKLVVERRKRVLGSQLRTRLVLGFVAVALAPAALLFVVALGFIQSSIEDWFSVQVESALVDSLDMAELYYREGMGETRREASEIAKRLAASPRSLAGDQRWLEGRQREEGLAALSLFDAAGKRVASATAEGLSDSLHEVPAAEFVEGGLAKSEQSDLVERDGTDVLRATARIVDRAGTVRGFVLVEDVVPRSIARRKREIEDSYRQYKQLKLLRRPVINNYVLTLLLVSLVVVFGGTWIGFAIARSLTVPLQRLAEGTRRVAQGRLDEQIPEDSGSEEVSALVTSFNQMTGILRATHTALAERRQALETILANIAGGVVSIDRQARIETVNAAARHMLGIEEDVVGIPFRLWFSSPRFAAIRELLSELDERAQQGIWERLPPHRLSIEHADATIQVLATGVVLKNDAQEAIGALLFFEDISEILRVQRMEAWREVARRIAHEIKNPLTPIQLSAQRLRKRYAEELSGSVLDECTRTIIAEVEVLRNLVSEFANFARLPAGPHVSTDLNHLVEDALVLFGEAHRDVVFDLEKDERLPLLELDRDGIRRVLNNLLDNAVAAVGARGATLGGVNGGSAEALSEVVASENEIRGRVVVVTRLDSARGVACLEVADDGPGMTPEVKARLFEPYFSTKQQGTGLGLAIVSSIVADHRGFIRVRDNRPRGSRFVIEFPLGRKEAEDHLSA